MSGIIILVLCAMVATVIGGRHLLKRRLTEAAARRNEVAVGEQCACGYPLTSLDMGRCPECGRVVSFNVTAEDLGLTKDQLARIADKRRQRADQHPKP